MISITVPDSVLVERMKLTFKITEKHLINFMDFNQVLKIQN